MWLVSAFRKRRRPTGCGNTSRHERPSVVVSDKKEQTVTIASSDSEANVSLLFSLAKCWAWNAVTFRCQTHPHEASPDFVDENGDSLLHWVVFGNPPVETVQVLLQACPDLAKVRNNSGLYPLHVACQYRASPSVLRILVNAYPQAAGQPTPWGSYPLHILADLNADPDSLQALLETTSGVQSARISSQTFQRTALSILSARKNMLEFQKALVQLRNNPELDILASGTCAFRRFWQSAALLAVAEYHGELLVINNSERQDDARILHAFVGNAECPETLQEFAVLLYSDQLLVPDSLGNVALHLAARSARSDRSFSLLYDVVTGNPLAACVRNADGHLPLVLAVENALSWSDGLGALVEANPGALRDLLHWNDSLMPLIWARLRSPSALFQSIRALVQVF